MWLVQLSSQCSVYCLAAACGPGQGRASSQEPCKPCPRNFYNPGGVKGECLRCPSGLVTVTEGASKCGGYHNRMFAARQLDNILRSPVVQYMVIQGPDVVEGPAHGLDWPLPWAVVQHVVVNSTCGCCGGTCFPALGQPAQAPSTPHACPAPSGIINECSDLASYMCCCLLRLPTRLWRQPQPPHRCRPAVCTVSARDLLSWGQCGAVLALQGQCLPDIPAWFS
jgi:hypothetical protein